MIRIMLVDDNRVALEYFSTLVNWEKLGYELVCTAIDGASALILFQKYHPEVIITDVQMPNMDGISLTREVMKIAPDTVMVFLSSYAEFSYIQSAMRFGVVDYILKHEMKAPELTKNQRTPEKEKR